MNKSYAFNVRSPLFLFSSLHFSTVFTHDNLFSSLPRKIFAVVYFTLSRMSSASTGDRLKTQKLKKDTRLEQSLEESAQ